MDFREVARRAKVSVATVSRALNRKPNLDSRLVRRGRKAVEELGYYPNAQARATGPRRMPERAEMADRRVAGRDSPPWSIASQLARLNPTKMFPPEQS